jgi:prepilin-type N-terminal cleavage/methylation domain-containing protein
MFFPVQVSAKVKVKRKNQRGFTLIELIAVLVILGIVGVLGSMGLVEIARGFILSKKSVAAAGQIQVAMARLVKEFSAIQSVTSAADKSITYARSPGETHTISWTTEDQPVTLDGDALIGNVKSFGLAYYNAYNGAASAYSSSTAVIQWTLVIKGYDDTLLTFVGRVAI